MAVLNKTFSVHLKNLGVLCSIESSLYCLLVTRVCRLSFMRGQSLEVNVAPDSAAGLRPVQLVQPGS